MLEAFFSHNKNTLHSLASLFEAIAPALVGQKETDAVMGAASAIRSAATAVDQASEAVATAKPAAPASPTDVEAVAKTVAEALAPTLAELAAEAVAKALTPRADPVQQIAPAGTEPVAENVFEGQLPER